MAKHTFKQRMASEKDKLFQMYHQEKFSLTDISEHYGCSRQYVHLIFKELGIKRRSRMMGLRIQSKRGKSKYNFTEDDDNFILGNYNKMTDSEIAIRLGKPLKSIMYRRSRFLGKKKFSRRKFTEKEDKFILDNFEKMTDTLIAKALNRTTVSVTVHRNQVLNRTKRIIKGYSDEEKSFIVRNYKDMTDSQIAAALNRTRASIAIYRSEALGLSKYRGRKKK